jgi:hypothetical protein
MTKQIALQKDSRSKPEQAFAHLDEVAADRGLTLLTKQWHGGRFEYRFRCPSGHEFTRIGQVAMRGTMTCLQCVQERTQRRFLEILAQQGIVCQEEGYPGQTARLHLQAAARGGRCLTDAYVGIRENYLWECANGHRWQARGAGVVKGRWCQTCFARRNGDARLKADRLMDLHAKAASHGGQCLDDAYRGSNARYRFRCSKGHEWTAAANLVLAKTWCPQCATQAKRLTIGQMRGVARARGGRCPSDVYLGNRVKLTWECHVGHVWSSPPNTVINRGAWCPDCFRLRITRNPALRKRYETPR